jgi:hypothetical protein
VNAASSDGNGKVTIAVGTTVKTGTGSLATSVSAVTMAEADKPVKPTGGAIVSPVVNFGPNGATFDKPATILINYTESLIPAGTAETSLVVAFFDGTKWVPLADSKIDAVANTATGTTTHFTPFAVISAGAPAPAPTPVPPTTTPPTTPAPTPVPPTTTPPTTPAPAPAPAPAVKINSPAAGTTITGTSVTIDVTPSNFQVVAPGAPNAANQGHIHYYLDVTIPTDPTKGAVTAAGTYQAVQTTTANWTNLTPGQHTLGVQLVNNDHKPLVPPVTATVTITVQAPAPATTTPPPATTTPPAKTTGGTNVGLIIGIIGGVVVVAALIFVIARRKK